jgi:hypothetical protein
MATALSMLLMNLARALDDSSASLCVSIRFGAQSKICAISADDLFCGWQTVLDPFVRQSLPLLRSEVVLNWGRASSNQTEIWSPLAAYLDKVLMVPKNTAWTGSWYESCGKPSALEWVVYLCFTMTYLP